MPVQYSSCHIVRYIVIAFSIDHASMCFFFTVHVWLWMHSIFKPCTNVTRIICTAYLCLDIILSQQSRSEILHKSLATSCYVSCEWWNFWPELAFEEFVVHLRFPLIIGIGSCMADGLCPLGSTGLLTQGADGVQCIGSFSHDDLQEVSMNRCQVAHSHNDIFTYIRLILMVNVRNISYMDPMDWYCWRFFVQLFSDPVHRSTVDQLDVSNIVEFSHVRGEWNTWNTFFWYSVLHFFLGEHGTRRMWMWHSRTGDSIKIEQLH